MSTQGDAPGLTSFCPFGASQAPLRQPHPQPLSEGRGEWYVIQRWHVWRENDGNAIKWMANDGNAIKWMANDIIAIKWIANDGNAIKAIAKMADSDSDSEYDSDSKKETSPLYYHIGGEAKKKFSLKRSLPVFKNDFSSFQLSLQQNDIRKVRNDSTFTAGMGKEK